MKSFLSLFAVGLLFFSISERASAENSASLSFSPPSFDFGTVTVGLSLDASFTITNGGGSPAKNIKLGGLGGPFSISGGAFPGTGGDCQASLAPGATCTIVVNFAPNNPGSFNTNMKLSYQGSGPGVTESLTGTGVGSPANLALSDTPTYDYGGVFVGNSVNHGFTLTNTGYNAAIGVSGATLSAPFSYKGGKYPGQGGNCGNSLNGNQSCQIVVVFAPTSEGASNGTLAVTYNNGSAQSVSVGLAGTGNTPALLSFSDPSPFSFGTILVGQSSSHTFTVTNSGSVAASAMSSGGLGRQYAYSGVAYPGVGGTCGNSLNSGGSCTISVTFSPSAAQTYNGSINLGYNDGTRGTSVVENLTGSGTNALAVLSLSNGPSFDYGSVTVGTSVSQTFIVTNTGAAAASGLTGSAPPSPFSFAGGTYPGTGGSCGSSLGANNQSCQIVVAFSPVAAATSSATLTLTYNNGAGSQSVSDNLSGTGVAPATASLSFTDSSPFSYGTLTVGSSLSHTFTLANSGAGVAGSLSVSGLGSGFAFAGGSYPGTGGSCGTSLAGNASCTIVVSFYPTGAGAFNSSLTMQYVSGGTQTLTENMTGQAQSAQAGQGGGTIDTTYGTGGAVATSIGNNTFAGGAAIQPSDGKLVLAGYVSSGSSNSIALVRYNTDGTLDSTFGSNGSVVLSIGGVDDRAYSVAVQSDGKIVVAGYATESSTGKDVAIARFNSDGSLDSSWNGVGYTTLDVDGGDDVAYAMAIQADGNIVVAGYTFIFGDNDMLVVRFSASTGDVDTSFNGDGIAAAPFTTGSDNRAYAVAIQNDGMIVIGGYSAEPSSSTQMFALARFQSNGVDDNTFNNGDFQLTTPVGSGNAMITGLAIQPGGQIVASGQSMASGVNIFTLVRYTPSAAVDTTFGSQGMVRTPIGSANSFASSIAVQSNGDLLVAGYSANGSGNLFAVARYSSAGSLDTSFGSQGTVTIPIRSGGDDRATAIALQPLDGMIVLGGYSTMNGSTEFAATRISP